MSIESLAEHELRSLVRYGSARFAGLAQAELDRRKKANSEAVRLKMEDGRGATAEPAPAFTNGRWP